MSTSSFGPMIAGTDVETAVLCTVEYWIDYYLTQAEGSRSIGAGTITRPRSFLRAYDEDNWPEGQVPSLACVCGETVEQPAFRAGDGSVAEWLQVEVGVMVEGTTEGDARRVASLYQSVLGPILTEQRQLNIVRSHDGTLEVGDQFAANVVFQGRKAIMLPDPENRTVAVGAVTVHVLVSPSFGTEDGPDVLPDPGVFQVAATNLTLDVVPDSQSPGG